MPGLSAVHQARRMSSFERALTLLRDEGLIVTVIGRVAFVNRPQDGPA
jgi:hypothetical protein